MIHIAIYSATSLSPSNIAIVSTVNNTFTWQSNGDAQTDYRLLIYRNDTNTLVYDSTKVTSTNTSHVLPANTLSNDLTYKFQIETFSGSNSAKSKWEIFFTNSLPTLTIGTLPTNLQTYNFTANYQSTSNVPIKTYHAYLYSGMKRIVATNGAHLDTSSYKFGTSSCYFDGVNDALTLNDHIKDFSFMHQPNTKWTFSCFIKPHDFTFSRYLFSTGKYANTDYSGVRIILTSTQSIQVYITNGIDYVINGNVGTYPTDTTNFHHVEVSCDLTLANQNIKVFIDGVLAGTINKSGTYSPSSVDCQEVCVGGLNGGITNSFYGYIDEVEILNIVKHTIDFTPTTSELTSTDNTLLLLHLNGSNSSTHIIDDNDSNISLISDSGELYPQSLVTNGAISNIFDGMESGSVYGIRYTCENQNGNVLDTGIWAFAINYTYPPSPETLVVTPNNSEASMLLDWQSLRFVLGKVTGTYSYTTGKFGQALQLNANSVLYYDTEKYPMEFSGYFYVKIPTGYKGIICHFRNNDQDLNGFKIFFNGISFGFSQDEYITLGRDASSLINSWVKIGVKYGKIIIQGTGYQEILSMV